MGAMKVQSCFDHPNRTCGRSFSGRLSSDGRKNDSPMVATSCHSMATVTSPGVV
jgi:hypothetical protein